MVLARQDSTRYYAAVDLLIMSLKGLTRGPMGEVFAHETTVAMDLDAPASSLESASPIPESLNFENGGLLPIDLAANARSYGITVVEVSPGPDVVSRITAAVLAAKADTTATLIHVTSDPFIYGPDGEGWWDVPAAEVSELERAPSRRTRPMSSSGSGSARCSADAARGDGKRNGARNHW